MNNIYSAVMPYISNAVERSSTGKPVGSGGNFDALLTSVTTTTTTTTTIKTQPGNASRTPMGGDEMAKFIQQVMASMNDSLSQILSPSAEYDKKTKGSIALDQAETIFGAEGDSSDMFGLDSATASSGMFNFEYESFVNGAGPLPAYLKMLDKSLDLSPEKSLKLRDIAWENRNIVKSPESVKALGDQLREAGIG